mgnify:FL=1
MKVLPHAALVWGVLISVISCDVGETALDEEVTDSSQVKEVFGENLPEESLLKGMNIKVDEGLAETLEKATDKNGFVKLPEVRSMNNLGIIRMRRLFPDAGEFEARTRAEGLHLWYVLSYDESKAMTRASAELALPGVDVVEYCPKISIVGEPEVVSHEASVRAASSGTFDDPMLRQQWHYYNNGSASSSVSGCDINVLPVWKNYSTYAKYKRDIVVGVVDGGIDYNHEDLKDNMWHNPEKSGDNVYGYNFAESTFNIHSEDHGTHVAGTIAAVNNNGIGVCGVAGGDSKRQIKGAKLMSCQIFDGDKQGSGPEAIKWSADHGAVISQNSWGYDGLTTTPASLKSAVDYFIKYAGVDKNGNQTGPMKGGIVIFAAGNDNKNVSSTDYEAVVNVSSVGADYKRAYYTNYGSWCDIAAPGGDAKKGNMVLSTLPGNKYGKMQGTSMACPHVSGVAALVLARYGGEGYTPTALRKRLEDNTSDISAQNANYYLGKGLVNAYKAIAGSGGKAPDTPVNLSVETQSNNVRFNVAVPSDPDDGKPNSIYIYYSTTDFTSVDKAMYGMFYTEDLGVGDILSGTVTGLEFNTEYYVAAAACDLAGNRSGLTKRVRVTTGGNSAPVITAKTPVSFSIKAHESAVAEFAITEPDGHFYSLELESGSDAAVLDTLTRPEPKIRITGVNAPAGTYSAKLTVTDIYGMATVAKVDYTIQENHAPVVVKAFENMLFTSKAAVTQEYPVSEYFNDEDGEDLTYTFSFSNPAVANMTYSKGKFLLTPMNYGSSEITITGTDVRNESVSQTFLVMVMDGSKEVSLYPNPVKDKLNIQLGLRADEVKVKIVSAVGSTYLDGSLGAGSPFTPLTVNMSDAVAGQYTVVVTLDGKEYKSRIVKL